MHIVVDYKYSHVGGETELGGGGRSIMPNTSLPAPAQQPLHLILLLLLLQAHILTDRDESPPRLGEGGGGRRKEEAGRRWGKMGWERERERERGRVVEMSCIPAGCYARNRHGVLQPLLRI